MATDTDVIVKLRLDTSTYMRDLNRTTDETSNKLKNGLGNAAKAAGTAIKAGLAVGTAAVAGLTKSIISAYGDYEQLTGGVETLFKTSADQVMNYAANAYKTAGLSANEYMEQATSFSARLIQGLGGDTAAAAKYADQAITDMSDNANKMGTDIAMIQNAYQGFAKQNYMLLDNLKLGYGGTAAEMARLINDSGVLGATVKVTASTVNSVSFDKMIEAIHQVQENLDITGTTAKEASSTIQGSVKSMQASWTNLLTTMADPSGDMNAAIDQFIESAGVALENLLPAVQRALEGISTFITEYGPTLEPTLESLFETLTPVITLLASALLEAVFQALPAILTTKIPTLLATVLAAILAFKAAVLLGMTATTTAIVTIVGAALVGLVSFIMENWESIAAFFGQVFGAIGEFLGGVFKGIGDAFASVADGIAKAVGWLGEVFGSVFQGAFNVIKSIFSGIGKFFSTIFGAVAELFGRVGQAIGDAVGGAFKAVINTILSFVEGFVNIPINAINGLISVINLVPGVYVNYLPTMRFPRLATGGIVPDTPGGRLILAGEGGQDEWVVPESKMASLVEQINRRLEDDGGRQNITINVSGTFATSPEERRRVADQIVAALEQNNRRRIATV